jgi:hypothetical protein
MPLWESDNTRRFDVLIEGYMAMATDALRESEALEWSDALIGDAFEE